MARSAAARRPIAAVVLALLAGSSALAASSTAVVVQIDAGVAKRHPINPAIYGLGMGSATDTPAADLKLLNSPVHRLGGNTMTTYNWLTNAANLAQDWYYESYPYASATVGAEVDSFVANAKAAAAKAMVTIPMIGWVAKLGPSRAVIPSFSISKYGAQQDHDSWYPDAGNGIKPDGSFVTGNDPNDAYVADTPATEGAFVNHLISAFGTAATNGPAYYLLDNEVSLWSSTHRDVRPVGPHAAEARDAMIAYSTMIRQADPAARIVGPEEWGWLPLTYSGYDQQWGGNNGWPGTYPDHDGVQGGKDYLAWMLGQLKTAGRPIDVFSVHYYPQSNEFSDDVSTATQLLRNQSTRELWDPNYVSQSWMASKIDFIHTLKNLVAANYYADAQTAITEYSWGADNHINGATTEADILGIFGREGLDLATRWGVPAASTPTFKAMQMYRNYDFNTNGFGDTGVSAAAPNPDALSAFAAIRTSDSALTTVIVNKALPGTAQAATSTQLKLANFLPGTKAMIYQLTSANAITRLADQSISGTSITVATPPQSVTMVILPASGKAVYAPPFARFTTASSNLTSAIPVSANLSVDATTSTAGTNAIKSYAWTFGDGGTGTGAKATHAYHAYGFFPVTLTVTDTAGKVAVLTKTVAVRPATSSARTCTAAYRNTGDWGSSFTANIHLTNTGSTTWSTWALDWSFAGNQTITNLWNGVLQAQGVEQLVTPASWDVTIAPGASVDVGFYAVYSGSNANPTTIKLNGMTCTLN